MDEIDRAHTERHHELQLEVRELVGELRSLRAKQIVVPDGRSLFAFVVLNVGSLGSCQAVGTVIDRVANFVLVKMGKRVPSV